MVAPTAREGFEGFADGATITTAGSVFTAANNGTGTKLARTVAAIKGSRGAEYGGTEVSSYALWTYTAATTSSVQFYFVKTSTNPTNASHSLAQIRSSTGIGVNITISTAGVLAVLTSTGSTIKAFNSGSQLPNGRYVLTVIATEGTTSSNGRVQAWLRDADSDTLIESAYDSGTTVNTGVDDYTETRLGKTNAAGTSSYFMDEFAYKTGSTAEIDRLAATGGAPVVNAGSDQTIDPNLVDSFDLVGTDSDDVAVISRQWRDITAGTPGTLLGTTATISSVPVVRSASGTTRTYRYSATDAGPLTTTDDVVVTFLAHTAWMMTTGGLVAIRRVEPQGTVWFVSKNGDNTTGTSWATAWNELNQIVWSSVAPGDTVEIDGGATSCGSNYDFVNHSTARPGLTAGMVYTTQLTPTVNGTATAPIKIRASTAAGHNGTVVIFGGRATALPEAGSSSYTVSGTGRTVGVGLSGRSYITLDGSRRSGIMVYGVGASSASVSSYGGSLAGGASGVQLSGTSSNITLRNLEIFDVGSYGIVTVDNTYKTDQEGITLGGTNITIDKCLIHDCGQDPIQGVAPVSNLTISNSWAYFRRQHSVWSGYGFNAGSQAITAQNTTHADGIQSYFASTPQGPVLLDHSIFGPMVNQGIYLGDANNGSFDDVTINHCTVLSPFRHAIQGDTYSSTTPARWSISNCTIHGPSTAFPGFSNGWLGVEIESGTGHAIRDTIVTWGAGFYTSSVFTGANSGNIYAGTGADAIPGGTNVDPAFVNALVATNNTPTYAQIAALNLTPTAGAAIGKGSDIVSVQTLLDRIDGLNGPISTSLTNTAEGTNGAALGASNVGAPNPFNTRTVSGTGATVTYDSTNAHAGTTSIKHHLPASVAATAYEEWKGSIIVPAPNSYSRFYLFLTAYPTVATRIVAFLSNGATSASLNLTTTGTVRTTNSAGSTLTTTTATVPLNQWVRVEFDVTDIAGSIGTVAARIFSGANLETTTADTGGTLSSTASAVTGAITAVRLGHSASVTMTTAWDTWYDDFAWANTASPGPS